MEMWRKIVKLMKHVSPHQHTNIYPQLDQCAITKNPNQFLFSKREPLISSERLQNFSTE
jgi:hypothetical protein